MLKLIMQNKLITLKKSLRPSDTYNLTRNDFKFTESKIFLNIKMGKTSKKLNVPISKRAAEIVLNSSFKLFPMFSEGRSSWSWERKEVRKTLRRCFGANNSAGAKYVNKRHIKLHTFRHTFAMRHIANGTPLEAIKQLLGHSSIAMCEKYARSMPKENLTTYLQ
jgi:integrase